MNKYLTTPIYYVNGKPHLGHAYTTILVDTFRRYYKLFNNEAMMLTGVDEYGQKVFEAAKANNLTPQEHCDALIPNFTELLEKCNIGHDIFFRTTADSHRIMVQTILQKLYDKGDIYKDSYVGNYCTPCETFYTDKDLVEGKCPECGRPTEIIEEENYFFDMAKYADKLQEHVENTKGFIKPDSRTNEVLGILKKGLRPLCISRKKEKMEWGIEIPFDKDYVTYVWFDALSNYIDGIGYIDNREQYEKYWPGTTHVIGKDILLHHTIYWPTMLLALGESLPQSILIHGWWLDEDAQKMSKSLGNVIEPLEIIEKYGSSAFRYYLLRTMSIGSDANFSVKGLIDRYNNELANDLGNLLNRATHMIAKNFDGLVPDNSKKTDFCKDFIAEFNQTLPTLESYLYNFELNKFLDEVIRLIKSTNKYLEDTAPWKLLKTDKELCGAVLYNALEAVRLGALLLEPAIPVKIEELKEVFAFDLSQELEFGKIQVGAKVEKAKALFPKYEYPKEEKKKTVVVDDNLIDISEFSKVEIKTGKILSAENVEGSDRLLCTKVEFGNKDVRQIIAGIAKYYKPEEVVGLHILAASNLKPAKIMGLDSEGMLLSVKQGKKLRLVTINEELPLGKKLI